MTTGKTVAFRERLGEAVAASGSLLCLGLDPDGVANAAAAEKRCLQLLDECHDAVCAVKANMAFFEQFGNAGFAVVERLRQRIPAGRLLIIDAKRGDIGTTAVAYARALYDVLGADAVTLNPLLGRDSIEPFLVHEDRGVFLLTRTSNPGAADFMTVQLTSGERLFERIVTTSRQWSHADESIGYVVGATDPAAVAHVRTLAGDAPLLAPGVGAQGGDLVGTVTAGLDSRGAGLIIPLSRGISTAADPGAAARKLRESINEIRARHQSATPS